MRKCLHRTGSIRPLPDRLRFSPHGAPRAEFLGRKAPSSARLKERLTVKNTLWIVILLLLCAPVAFGASPQVKHVVLVVEENHSYDAVISQGGMPYLKSLAEKYTVLTNYYGNHHPSMGNY